MQSVQVTGTRASVFECDNITVTGISHLTQTK